MWPPPGSLPGPSWAFPQRAARPPAQPAALARALPSPVSTRGRRGPLTTQPLPGSRRKSRASRRLFVIATGPRFLTAASAKGSRVRINPISRLEHRWRNRVARWGIQACAQDPELAHGPRGKRPEGGLSSRPARPRRPRVSGVWRAQMQMRIRPNHTFLPPPEIFCPIVSVWEDQVIEAF